MNSLRAVRYILLMIVLFATIVISAKRLAQHDGVLRDHTLVKKQWKA